MVHRRQKYSYSTAQESCQTPKAQTLMPYVDANARRVTSSKGRGACTSRGSGGASPYRAAGRAGSGSSSAWFLDESREETKPLFALAAFGRVHFDICGGYGSVH